MAVAGPIGRHRQSNNPEQHRRFAAQNANRAGANPPQARPSFLEVSVTNLPINVNTLDIHENFKKFGEVTSIKIFETGSDGRTNRCDIRFEPPPSQTIWSRKHAFVKDARTTIVMVQLSKRQPTKFKVNSPVRKGVEYNEKIELRASTILFGVLLEPRCMMSLTSRGDPVNNVRMVLDLFRKQIEIFFPSWITSDSRRACRAFRFQIALDEKFTVWRTREGYVLHLPNPPWYSKQLKEAIALTHAVDAKRWSLEDTWARQTDIVEHKTDVQMLNSTAISLVKNFNNINIARWTTFKINTLATPQNDKAEQEFQSALRDFNVDVRTGSAFQIKRGPKPPAADISAWELINGSTRDGKPISFVHQFSSPALAFKVRYQLQVCLSHGWLSEYTITPNFMHTLSSLESAKAIQMLVFLDSYQEREFNPMKLFTDLKYRRPVKQFPIPHGHVELRSATVTATSIKFHTPTVEVTNRIIRKYSQHIDHFLRVRFEDDESRGQSRLYASSNSRMVQVFQRVRRALRHGIKMGEMHYEFLAWGNSQLREHGAYFFAKAGHVSASSIRAEMGAFDHEKVIAKRAARMGQCFSTTRPVHLRIPIVTQMNTIPDITNNKVVNPITFTDGVGKISPLAAQVVHQQLRIKGPVPSAFQFRLGGCKGVLVVWPDLTNTEVKVRASQFKFNSKSTELEVIRWSEFWQPFLNRQIILCLSDLGVPDDVFLGMQHDTIVALDAAMRDDAAATRALRDCVDPNSMTLSLCDLISAGFRSRDEPFTLSVLHLWRAWSLKYLKEKAKIPVSKGAFVLGCADETNTLKGHFDQRAEEQPVTLEDRIKALPEIFIQIMNPQTKALEIVTGPCILARNPSLHRGDIRVVNAVDAKQLRHLYNVVVVPVNGDRDLPSMCSGGDLDGDDYVVLWDERLLPSEWNAEPFHYDPPPAKTTDKEITTDDIIDFFYDYLRNDQLGRIAHSHLAAGDYLEDGIQSQTCLELVNLHSMAVDYPKTGVPAVMERRLERNLWPHFMEKKGAKYTSHKILGRLYDAVERVAFDPIYNMPFDHRILSAYKPTREMMASIKELKHEYDNAMQRIMAQHDIGTEFEVWTTFVLAHSKAAADFKFHEEIGNIARALKEQYETALVELAGSRNHESLVPVAVAAYSYTHAQVQAGLREVAEGIRMSGAQGMPFISFPWLLQDTLCRISRQLDGHPEVAHATLDDSQLPTFVDVPGSGVHDTTVPATEARNGNVGLTIRPAFRNHLPDPFELNNKDQNFRADENIAIMDASNNSEVGQRETGLDIDCSTTRPVPSHTLGRLIDFGDDDGGIEAGEHEANNEHEVTVPDPKDATPPLGRLGPGNVPEQAWHVTPPTSFNGPFSSLRKQLKDQGYGPTVIEPAEIHHWLDKLEERPARDFEHNSIPSGPSSPLHMGEDVDLNSPHPSSVLPNKDQAPARQTDSSVDESQHSIRPATPMNDPLMLDVEDMTKLGLSDDMELFD